MHLGKNLQPFTGKDDIIMIQYEWKILMQDGKPQKTKTQVQTTNPSICFRKMFSDFRYFQYFD